MSAPIWDTEPEGETTSFEGAAAMNVEAFTSPESGPHLHLVMKRKDGGAIGACLPTPADVQGFMDALLDAARQLWPPPPGSAPITTDAEAPTDEELPRAFARAFGEQTDWRQRPVLAVTIQPYPNGAPRLHLRLLGHAGQVHQLDDTDLCLAYYNTDVPHFGIAPRHFQFTAKALKDWLA